MSLIAPAVIAHAVVAPLLERLARAAYIIFGGGPVEGAPFVAESVSAVDALALPVPCRDADVTIESAVAG